ncbi:threonine-phosphate decarboxylase CobD [Trichlorobacter ammonificans]|uniref:threonine-phosphate decarboxylase n=1 Tax=Trichlorobacter ammonificans TaxID=2916410 RepID=A0ABN8HHU1_9BACT|nr:threonine-phosphate decarboxylase CobD [Trichlorobacter ammonificans]CAH2032385.1 L-threonine 3-O-phosphate decarboxylase [Trichlorobacter ammonificans]
MSLPAHDKPTSDHGGTIYATARALGCAVDDLLDFSASINPRGPSAAVRQALLAALHHIPHYPDSDATELRRALARFHHLPEAAVVPASGSTPLIHLVPGVVAGERGMVVCPAFNEYEHALKRHGWKLQRHLLSPDDGFALHLDRLADDLARQRPDVLFFCTPANPTGRLYPAGEVRNVLELCGRYGTLLVLDEAFMDFCGEEQSAKAAVVASGRGIVLRSLTKFHALAGLRLGCALAPPELAEKLRAAQPPWELNNLAQVAGVAALADPAEDEATRRMIAEERTLLAELIGRIPGIEPLPSSTNYLLLRLGNGLTAPALRERMVQRHRIMVRDCSNFYGLGETFLRVAVRSREENRRLAAALSEVVPSQITP